VRRQSERYRSAIGRWKMTTCGFPDARWDFATHKLTLCYELATDKTVGPAAFKPNQNNRKYH
jgi:hypothetical protein